MMNSVPAGVRGTDRRDLRGERPARRVRRAVVPRHTRRMRRVFIPNRGEIAVRIVSACRQVGAAGRRRRLRARPEGDGGADRRPVVCIGPGPGSDSYLRADVVVHAALGTGCDAIHPGYGFLVREPACCPRRRVSTGSPSSARRCHAMSWPGTSSPRAPRRGAPGSGPSGRRGRQRRSGARAGRMRSATRCWSRRPAGEGAAGSSASTRRRRARRRCSGSRAARPAPRSATTASTWRS